jgi:hypothetical protein
MRRIMLTAIAVLAVASASTSQATPNHRACHYQRGHLVDPACSLHAVVRPVITPTRKSGGRHRHKGKGGFHCMPDTDDCGNRSG